MGRAGRANAEQRFSLNAMVATYRRTYDMLLANAGASALRSAESN